MVPKLCFLLPRSDDPQVCEAGAGYGCMAGDAPYGAGPLHIPKAHFWHHRLRKTQHEEGCRCRAALTR